MIIYDDDGVGHNVVPMKVIEDIKADIEQTVNEETDYYEIWARGLHYSLKIIDKHISGKEQDE